MIASPAERAALRNVLLDPVRTAGGLFGFRPWEQQRRLMRSIAQHPMTAVKACHASGKTAGAAQTAVWWLIRYPRSLVLTTAPTWRQVKLMWSEIRYALRQQKMPIFPEPSATGVKIVDQHGSEREILGISTNDPQKFRGYHADHVLILVDEATGVLASIWDEIEGIRSGGHVHLAILGNPTVASGKFFEAHHGKERSIWNRFTISAFDTPNFDGIDTIEQLLALTDDQAQALIKVPYLINPVWVRERYHVWGPKHPSFVSRVLGLFPDQDPHSLYSGLDLDRAAAEEITEEILQGLRDRKLRIQFGLDVAGPGDDETVLVARAGEWVLKMAAYPHDPRGDYRGQVLRSIREIQEWAGLPIAAIVVDSTGIGHNMALHVADVHPGKVYLNQNGERALDSERFVNLKAEQYWGARERLQSNRLRGLVDEECRDEARGIRYRETPGGRIEIEQKEQARKRGVTKSPDRWEATVLAFANIVPKNQRETFGGVNRSPLGAY